MQAAAVSVCQYLASEVHKPQDLPMATPPTSIATGSTSSTSSANGSKAKQKKKTVTVAQPPASKATPPTKSKAKPAAELPPPSSLVSQIMEMGFPRKHIEKAIEVSYVYLYVFQVQIGSVSFSSLGYSW